MADMLLIKLFLASLAMGCILVVFVILRRIFFHPLSSYPGPLLSKFSDVWTVMAVVNRARTFRQYEVLKRYGSPVRIGTNHLLFSERDSYQDIYGQSSLPCIKQAELYDGMSATGATNILSAVDRHQHARLRRLVAHNFSVKTLLEAEPFVQAKIDQYLSAFEGLPGQQIDIFERTYELFLDIVSQLSFGESFDCLEGKNPTAHRDVQAFFTVVPAMAWAPFVRHLPVKSIQEGLKGLARLEEFSNAQVNGYLARSSDKSETGNEGKFLQNLASAVDSETGTRLTQAELVEKAIIFLTAGSGTTAATMIYLIWECGRNGAVRKRLIDEIRTAFPDPKVAPTYEEASKLTYTGCVVDEVLRLWGPLTVGLTRISPGKSIAGRWVPAGVAIETSSYATARDPRVFTNPLNFDPSRWEDPTPHMRQMSRPFSTGPRNCVGRHLAEIGLVLTVVRLYQKYDIVPDRSLTPDEMKQMDFGVLEPGCDSFFVTPLSARR